MDGYFTREFEITCDRTLTLTFYQREVGDVSCVVWDAAMVLAKYLERKCQNVNGWLRGRSVLELGSGLGCVGLTAACFGARVTMTDLAEVIPLLKKNIDANKDVWTPCGGNVHTEVLHWGEPCQDFEVPDLIFLADCVYYEESVEPLVRTLCSVAAMKTEIIICQEERDTDKQQLVWKNFQQELLKHFDVTNIPEKDQHPEFSSPDIVVLHARRKCRS